MKFISYNVELSQEVTESTYTQNLILSLNLKTAYVMMIGLKIIFLIGHWVKEK